MIKISSLINTLKKNNSNFFTGVPDSVLKELSIYLQKKSKKNHVIATNEGSAISIAIGHYLSTKRIPSVYMQNSGLSNALNPLISIAHPKVYSIPLVLIIGWRGSPRVKDEPQHNVKGKITEKILKLLNIKYTIIRTNKDLTKFNNQIKDAKKNKSIVACLIEQGTLEKNNKKIKKKDFYMVGGMGHTSSVALGYSLSTNKKTICVDGDGSFLMHLGSIKTAGTFANKNFKYILLNNNTHDSVGGQSTYAKDINFEKLSKSLGFKKFYSIKDNQNLKKNLKQFLSGNSLNFLEVKVTNSKIKNLPRPKNLINIKNQFMK